ncbi:MAG: transporter [Fibrobacter sp.]|nr:transporter [Fibrobacter sp.]
MFKKIALALTLIATASFATWDYYSIPREGIGSVKAGFYYDKHNQWSQMGLELGARIDIAKKFEIALMGWGYQFWNEEDCRNCYNGGSGLRDLTIGGRYEAAPMITAFLDLNIPTGRNEYDGQGTKPPSNDEFSIYLGAQFSVDTKVKGFKIGGEAGLDWGFAHNDHERGLDFVVGMEGAFTIPDIGLTPYLGFEFTLRLTESEWEENNGRDHGYDDDGSTQFNLWFGGSYAVLKNLAVDARFKYRHLRYKGDRGDGNPHKMDGDAFGFYLGVNLDF